VAITSPSDLTTQLATAAAAGGAVVHVVAGWADSSKPLAESLTRVLATGYPAVKLLEVDADGEAATVVSAESVPFVLFYAPGLADPAKPSASYVGADIAAINAHLSTTFGAPAAPAEAGGAEEDLTALDARVRGVVSSQKIMVLMKGTPEDPYCGFSRQLVELLKELGFEHPRDYGYVDIFTDEPLRQRVKTLFSFPTFPQLYVKGELIGGIDIARELHAAGELVPTLQAAE